MPSGFYELLEAIRRRPGMYLGQKSLRDFAAWLQGYFYGKSEAGLPDTEAEVEFRDFDEFVQEKYQWHDVGGWAAKIQYYHRDDAAALDEFFKLLDEFRESKRETETKTI
jgi:hypothetical protein